MRHRSYHEAHEIGSARLWRTITIDIKHFNHSGNLIVTERIAASGSPQDTSKLAYGEASGRVGVEGLECLSYLVLMTEHAHGERAMRRRRETRLGSLRQMMM